MMSESNHDWLRLFDADTAEGDVLIVAARCAEWAIANLATQLAADADLSPTQRAAILAHASKAVHARCRVELLSAWQRLQGGALPDGDGRVH